MNTQFIAKTVAPATATFRSRFEIWAYNLLNAVLVGATTAGTTSVGMFIVHASGAADVPTINWHIFETVLASGAIAKGLIFLSQGLPKLPEPSEQPSNEGTKQ